VKIAGQQGRYAGWRGLSPKLVPSANRVRAVRFASRADTLSIGPLHSYRQPVQACQVCLGRGSDHHSICAFIVPNV